MKYKILQNRDPQVVVDKVNEDLQAGWKPLGGISVATRNSEAGWVGEWLEYTQAMIRGD